MKTAKVLIQELSESKNESVYDYISHIQQLVSRNNHTEAYLFIAETILHDRQMSENFKAVLTLQKFYGGLDQGLSTLQYDLYKKLVARAKSKLHPDEFESLTSAL